MNQLSLFDDGSQPLLDDATGRVTLTSQVVSQPLAALWFESVRKDVVWQEGRRLLYEREVDVPRLYACFFVDDPNLAPVLRDAVAVVSRLLATPFNRIGLNLYRNHRDSVAPHNDRVDELVRGQPIALLSLGATRSMTIRSKRPPGRVLHMDLEAGSVLAMSWQTQLHFDHAIPKQSQPCGPRISLAFRVHQRGKAGNGTAQDDGLST